ncbi:MAG: hypothetical protein MHPDNHAH_03485 [Anaerolineales bacterium]|nr:hypothetical protein [Anaerolineales bacterium]WKZ48339.1 MAG: glycosyltransferase family 10 [Anaerolineales bacterium]
MKQVRLIHFWGETYEKCTPGNSGIWDGIHFTSAPVPVCDYSVVIHRTPGWVTELTCPLEHLWLAHFEPPIRFWQNLNLDNDRYAKVFTTDPNLRGDRYIHTNPLHQWMIKRDYDFLSRAGTPEKTRDCSWIMRNIRVFPGHQARQLFLEQIRMKINFDLFGRGYEYIDDKWDGLAPYRYSFVIENHQNDLYWSEKIMDSFLAWTMPIYFGARKITDFFPAESIIQIDLNDPDVVEKIKSAMADNSWAKNFDAIQEARRRVLNEHHILAKLARYIHIHEDESECSRHSPSNNLLYRAPTTLNGRVLRNVLEILPRKWRVRFGELLSRGNP